MVDFASWFTGSDEATKNKSDDTQRAEDQNVTWDTDRAAFGGEWSGLVGEWGGDFAPTAILEKDGFPAMTHQQIYEALQGVDPALINDKATAWRGLADEARAANKEFLDGVNADLEAGWNGESGTAAVAGVRAFSTSFEALAASFQMVGHGLDLIEGHLAHAKASVGAPDNETLGDRVTNWLPDDMFKTPQYRADEAQETARWVMTTYYEPGAAEVDGKTPILPEPKKPVDDGGGPEAGRPPGRNTDNGTSSGNGTDPGDGAVAGEGAAPEGQGQPGEPEEQPGTEPAGTEPSAAAPQNAAPAPTVPQSTTPTTPSLSTGAPVTPGMPSGAPTGTPSGAPQTAPPVPGQTIPGGPGQGPAGMPAAAPANAGASAGRAGAPGMMPGGARGGGRDDEDEHDIPDYLIYDRGSELLGTQPPALPPGGVIGG